MADNCGQTVTYKNGVFYTVDQYGRCNKIMLPQQRNSQGGGGRSGVRVEDESIPLGGGQIERVLNFLGSGVSAIQQPNGRVDITIPGSAGGVSIINASRASLVTMKGASTLIRGQWYFDTTDSIYLFAVETNDFSIDAILRTGSNTNDLKYTFDTNTILSRFDTNKNLVENSFSTFLFDTLNVLSNKLTSDAFVDVSNNSGTFSDNEIRENSVVIATNNAGTISGNDIDSSGALTATNQAATGVINFNRFSRNGSLSASTNAGIILHCLFDRGCDITMNLNNGILVNNCTFESVTGITLLPTKAEDGKTLKIGFSDFEQTLDMDDPAIYNAGTKTLTIPVSNNYFGIFNLNGASANYDIDSIVNLPTNHPVTFRRTQNTTTLTIIPTAVAGALSNDVVLESLVNLVLTGRVSSIEADFLQLSRGATFNRQIDASVLA